MKFETGHLPMHKFLIIFILTMFCHIAWAILPNQVTSGRGYIDAIQSNPMIRRYLEGREPATPELLLEMFSFLDQMNSRKPGVKEKATELLTLIEEVGNQIQILGTQTRTELQPILNRLLNHFPVGLKNEILLRIFNRFWFWSPENLDFMARAVRNDRSREISTQLMWVLERSSKEQRQSFFQLVPERQPNVAIRWFYLALVHKYGPGVDAFVLRRSLRRANFDRLRPEPRSISLNGTQLPTTADLYLETWRRLRDDSPELLCAGFLETPSPPLAPYDLD